MRKITLLLFMVIAMSLIAMPTHAWISGYGKRISVYSTGRDKDVWEIPLDNSGITYTQKATELRVTDTSDNVLEYQAIIHGVWYHNGITSAGTFDLSHVAPQWNNTDYLVVKVNSGINQVYVYFANTSYKEDLSTSIIAKKDNFESYAYETVPKYFNDTWYASQQCIGGCTYGGQNGWNIHNCNGDKCIGGFYDGNSVKGFFTFPHSNVTVNVEVSKTSWLSSIYIRGGNSFAPTWRNYEYRQSKWADQCDASDSKFGLLGVYISTAGTDYFINDTTRIYDETGIIPTNACPNSDYAGYHNASRYSTITNGGNITLMMEGKQLSLYYNHELNLSSDATWNTQYSTYYADGYLIGLDSAYATARGDTGGVAMMFLSMTVYNTSVITYNGKANITMGSIEEGEAGVSPSSISVSITAPSNTTYSTTSVPLTFSVSSINTVSQCWYYIRPANQNISLPSCAGLNNITGMTAGTNNITVFANDTINNITSSSRSFTRNIPTGTTGTTGSTGSKSTGTGINGIASMIGNNYTNYLFGNATLSMLFFLAIMCYFMFKLGLSLDAAVPIFIALGITLSVALGNAMTWIIVFIIGGILYFAIRQALHR